MRRTHLCEARGHALRNPGVDEIDDAPSSVHLLQHHRGALVGDSDPCGGFGALTIEELDIRDHWRGLFQDLAGRHRCEETVPELAHKRRLSRRIRSATTCGHWGLILTPVECGK